MKSITVVIPVHNEEKNVPLIVKVIQHKLRKYAVKILFVNDYSTDRTLAELIGLNKNDPTIGFISFTRQYGKEAALLAGLKSVNSDYVAIMDADFQDPPELLVTMAQILDKQKDVDVVATKKANYHKSKFIGAIFSQAFYRIAHHLTGIDIPNGSRDFRMMRIQVITDYLKYHEHARFSRYIFTQEGYNIKYITFGDAKRKYGKSSWNFDKLIGYALTGIIGNSNKIPEIMLKFSLLFELISIILLILGLCITNKLLIIGGILLVIQGILIGAISIVSLYTAQILIEVKNRPDFLIKIKQLPKEKKQ